MWWVPLAGAAISAGASALGQSSANKSNLRIAREQMAFQERMSSTAYQRAVGDMKAAGINPMLAIEQGGASAPGGASATMQDVVGPAVSTALQGIRLLMDYKQMRQDLQMKQAQTMKTMQEGLLTSQLVNAFGQRLPGMESFDNIRNALARAELSTARNMVSMQERGYLGKFLGLDVDTNLRNLFSWINAIPGVGKSVGSSLLGGAGSAYAEFVRWMNQQGGKR